MSVKTGTRQLGLQPGAKVVKAQNGTRNVRCQGCGHMTVAAPDGQGGTQYQCPNCKRVYKFEAL